MNSAVFGNDYTFIIDLYKYIALGKGAGGFIYILFNNSKENCIEFGAKCYIYTFLSVLCIYIAETFIF